MLLGTLSPNPGFLTHPHCHGRDLQCKGNCRAAPEQTEELTVELISVPMIQSLIKQGEIEHGVCVAGLLWWLAQSDEANHGKP